MNRIRMRALNHARSLVPLALSLAGTAFLTSPAIAAEGAKEKPNAARSVHLGWQAPKGTLFYNEIRILESTTNTYFCVAGFSHGYFGLQDFGGRKPKVAIFSIWDPGKQDDPSSVAVTNRVELLYKDPDVRTGRFGGEGTGGQSFLNFDWKIGSVYRFLVHAKVEGKKTAFAGYLYDDARKQWRHLVTFRTLTGGDPLHGYYSFIEDFRRDGRSPNERRVAEFGNGWVRNLDGQWFDLSKARFTGDPTPLMNIDAGPAKAPGWFFLQTGGASTNSTVELWKTAERAGLSAPPEILTSYVPEP